MNWAYSFAFCLLAVLPRPALAIGSSEHEAMTPASASVPSAKEAARDMRDNGLAVRPAMGLFSTIAICRDGRRVDLGFLGGRAAQTFGSDAITAGHLRAHTRSKIVGVSLWSVGLAALVADLVWILRATRLSPAEVRASWGVLGGGAAATFVGTFFLQHADRRLADAAAAHNAALINQYLPPMEAVEVSSAGISLASPRLSLTMRF